MRDGSNGRLLGILAVLALAATSQAQEAPPTDDLTPTTVVARVDGEVILYGDVLSAVKPMLEQARRQMSAEKYIEFEWQLLGKATDQRVERQILMQELKSQVTKKSGSPEAFAGIERAARKDFLKYLVRRAKEQKLARADGQPLEAFDVISQLQKEGMDVGRLEANYVADILSRQYLMQVIGGEIKEPGRSEMLAYYQAHAADFADKPGAVWRHIQIDHAGNPTAARQRAAAILSQLRAGADFAALAKEHSDGPTAVAGGLWSRTSPGSYADRAVDSQLFAAPVGPAVGVIEGATACHIVRIEERSDGKPAPFTDVQNQIRSKLKEQQFEALKDAKLAEIRGRHFSTTIFADQVAADPSATLLRR